MSVDGPGGRDEIATGPAGELATGPLLAGSYTLRVEVPGYLVVERAVEVAAGAETGAVTARGVRIELERGALLAGVVRDRYGSRVPGAEVTVGRDGAQPVSARTDSEGEFRLRDVPTGDVTVRAGKGSLTGEKPISLRPGDELLSFEIAIE